MSFGVDQIEGSVWMDGVVDVKCPSSQEIVHEGGIGRIGSFTMLVGAVHEGLHVSGIFATPWSPSRHSRTQGHTSDHTFQPMRARQKFGRGALLTTCAALRPSPTLSLLKQKCR